MDNPRPQEQPSSAAPPSTGNSGVESDYKLQSFTEKKRDVDSPRGQSISKSAIFVAHGMGQQLRFETLAQIAEGLRDRSKDVESKVIPIKADDRQLHGIRLTFVDGRIVDIFESYWAPLTEGEITIRDVIWFLINAGFNGIKHALHPFKRFLFDRYYEYKSNDRGRVLVSLLASLAVVISLVVMNSAIAFVIAGRSPIAKQGTVSSEFVSDLTTVFNLFLVFVIAYISVLAWAFFIRNPEMTPANRKWVGRITMAFFFPTVLATIVGGVLIGYLAYCHLYLKVSELHFQYDWVHWINEWLGIGLISTIPVLLLILLVSRLLKRLWQAIKNAAQGTLPAALLLFLGFWGLAFLIAWEISPYLPGGYLEMISWPLLVVISYQVRTLLVQYVGDVAIYITPYSLDRFFNLRGKIRDLVTADTKVVYAACAEGKHEYEKIYLVGHSLGSVIVYDALNRLLVEDDANNDALNVAGRTKFLVTFGSPLDKIAFLFDRPVAKLCEARDALAASTQPLIGNAKLRRFPWINIYSPLDIISGALNFFDPPIESKQNRGLGTGVVNLKNPQATVYLAAHTEYWSNNMLFEVLLYAIAEDWGELEKLINRDD